nr:uncharacterized protein LOC117277585 [Nicotiana tomentosiformis]
MNNNPFSPKQYNQKIDFDQSRGNVFYKYCKKSCHTIDKYYKLHGFPQNFKFNKGKRVATNVSTEIGCPYPGLKSASPQICNGIPGPPYDDQASSIPGLTKQQYSQLMSLLQQTQISYDSDSQSNLMASANFAAVVSPVELGVKLKSDDEELLPRPDTYRSLVGKLNFLTHTKPDLCFTVQHFSQFLKCLRVPHMNAALHILRYLKGTPNVGIFLNIP